MMRSSALLLLLVGAALANTQNAWEDGKQYTYKVRSRTLAAFNQQSKQFTGVVIEAYLQVQANGPNTLRAKILQPHYCPIHTRLENGWESDIPRDQRNMQGFDLSGKPFEIKTKNGVVQDLIVNKDVPTWEVNVIKSIVSQLNVDTQGQNVMNSKENQLPEGNQPNALFKTMEDSVTGKCEVVYDISTLPRQMLQNKPELAPMPELRKDGDLINIMKTKNYTNCNQRVSYHFGIDRRNNWEPGSNDNTKYLSRSTISRIVISGNLKKYTIQSSVTTNKVMHSADQHETEQGMVASKMNLTLHEVKDISQPIPAPMNPESTGNLVYNYNNPFGERNSRRPNKPNALNSKHEQQNNRKNHENEHDSQESNESVEEPDENSYLQPMPKLSEPAKNPMSPFFIGNHGTSIKNGNNKIDVVRTAKQIAQEIGNDIQKPDTMFDEQTLDKYTILTRLIRVMNAEQIAEVQRDLYEPKQESSNQLHPNNPAKTARRDAWAAFRDAVAQSGTGPALVNVKQWVQNKQIKGLEAAEVVDAVAQAARSPTPEYVEAYYELVNMQQTKEQALLHDTAVIAFADLLRHAGVDRRSQHNRYPVHAFGRFFPKKNHKDIHEKYIPYLGDELRKAVDNGDSRKIQIYSAAIGRVGDPRILSVLEPYLEGQRQVSPYQRYVMVLSLDRLAISYPKVARAVLYKIYSNNADHHEIRTAAVYLLMMTNPPASMLQRMAEYTNYDSNKFVNSAVKSTIESLARQDGVENRDLYNAARAAQPLLTPENYRMQYSRATFLRLRNPFTQSGLFLEANYIGSDDSLLPKGVYASVSPTYKGLKLSSAEAGATVSSVRDLWSLVKKLVHKHNQSEKEEIQKDQEQQYSPEKISKLLGIHGDEPQQVEGFFFGNGKAGNYFVAFDNHTLEKIPEQLKQLVNELKNGKPYAESRLTNYEVTISFPTETGFPFQFNLRNPIIAHIDGLTKLTNDENDSNSNIPKKATLSGKVNVVLAMEVQKRLGFVTPFEHQQYLVGVDRTVQVHVPVRGEITYDKKKHDTRLSLQPNEDVPEFKLLQYKTQPFTSKHDIMNMEPITKDKNTHVIHKDRTTRSQMEFNDMNNKRAVQFEWERQTWHSQEENERRENKRNNDRESMQKLSRSLMEMTYPKEQGDAEYEKYSLKLAPSSDMKAEVRLSYDEMMTDNNNNIEDYESWSPKAKAPRLDSSLNEDERKQQLMREAAKNINAARAGAFNINFQLTGGFSAFLGLTAAGAKSNSDPKSRAMLFVAAKTPENEEYFLSAGLEDKAPNYKSMDYEQTLQQNKPREFDAEIRFGRGNNGDDENSQKIEIQGKAKLSEERKNAIRQSRDVQECNKEENKSGNKLGLACQKANMRAQMMNFGEMTIKFEDNSPLSRAAMGTLEAAEQAVGSVVADAQKDRAEKSQPNEIKVTVELSPNDEKSKVLIKSPTGVLKIDNIPMLGKDNDNNGNVKDTRNKENPDADSLGKTVCSLDKTEMKTFDDKRYPLRLGECWHVAMTTFPKNNADNPSEQLEIPENMHVTVLAKDDENGLKKLKVTIGDTRIELMASVPRQVEARVSGQNVELSHKKNYQGKQNENVAFDLFKLADGTAKIVSNKYDIKIWFDGSRAQIKAGDRYRKSVRGLCGNNDGAPENDQKTPKGCTLQRPEEFVATYALLQEDQCKGPALENAQKAKNSECTFRKIRPGNVISEHEAGRVPSGNKNQDSSEEDSEGQCMKHRTMVTRTDDQICFSLRPVPKCSSRCSVEGEKNVNISFHCVRRTSTSERVAERVEQGANPDLTQKDVSKIETHRIPLFCKA